jgi:glycine cleavage system transcriptional repressor
VLSVYGADHPGIVHSIASSLAEREISITGLETRVAGGEDSPIYVMLMEIALGGANPEDIGTELERIGSAEGLDVSLRELSADAL